jgi:predicted PurR-regulated permease PerM
MQSKNRYFIKTIYQPCDFMPFSFTSEQKQTWLWVMIGLGLAGLFLFLGRVLTPFIAGILLAYALNPAVDWLAARRIGRLKMPRSIAIMVIMLLLLAAILAVILIVMPILQNEIPLLLQKIPHFLAKLDEAVSPHLHSIGIDINLDSAGIERIISEYLANSSNKIWRTALSSARTGGLAVLGWIGTLSLIPIVLFYFLLDWHAILTRCQNSIPRRWVGKTVSLATEVNSLLAQYLRGELTVMLTLVVYYSVSLAIAGFDVALPVGILTGLLVFIPYLGFGLGLFLALVAAVLQFDGPYGLIAVACIYGIGQFGESFFLTPRLVGERIGLHPLVIIFALLAFGQIFGFVGVLLALPASAVVSVIGKHLRVNYLNSTFYNQS